MMNWTLIIINSVLMIITLLISKKVNVNAFKFIFGLMSALLAISIAIEIFVPYLLQLK